MPVQFLESNSVSDLEQDWKYPRTAKGFIAGQDKSMTSTVLRCVTNTEIPCTAQEAMLRGDKLRFSVTVLEVSQVGFAYAPYKRATGNKKVQRDPNAKPLFELTRRSSEGQAGEFVGGVKMFSFKKANSNFDRGEFDASKETVIHKGSVLSFFIHQFMYEAKDKGQSLFPHDNDISVIPEFTVVDLKIMCAHNECSAGYGLKIQRVDLHPTTLYSYFSPDSLGMLPSTIMEAQSLADERLRESPFIANVLATKNVAFFAKVPRHSYIAEKPVADGYYRLLGPNSTELFPGVPSIDISVRDLLKFANVVRGSETAPGSPSAASATGDGAAAADDAVLDAITFFDFASAAGALCVYVVSVQHYKTGDLALADFRGVPLVDVNEFTKGIDMAKRISEKQDGDELDEQEIFDFGAEIPSLSKNPSVTVFTQPVTHSQSSGVPAPCPDFSLMSEACAVKKGYLFSIGSSDFPEALKLVFNVMGCQSASVQAMRRMDYAARAATKRKAVDLE